MSQVLSENEAYLLNLFFICILYGVYFPMFLENIRTLNRTGLSFSREGWSFWTSLFLATSLLFVFETLSVVLELMQCMDLLIEPRPKQRMAVAIGISLSFLTIPIGDAILLYRCYLVYGCKKRFIVGPFAIWFISCGVYIGDPIYKGTHKGGQHITSVALTVFVSTAAIMTCILNATLTIMIAHKIWKAYRLQREAGLSSYGRPKTRMTLQDAQRIVIETGSLWLAAGIFALGASLSRSNISIIAVGVAKHTSGIAFSLMNLRVSWKTQGARSSSEQSDATSIHHSSEMSSGLVFAAAPKGQDSSFAMLELPKRDPDHPTPAAARVIDFA